MVQLGKEGCKRGAADCLHAFMPDHEHPTPHWLQAPGHRAPAGCHPWHEPRPVLKRCAGTAMQLDIAASLLFLPACCGVCMPLTALAPVCGMHRYIKHTRLNQPPPAGVVNTARGDLPSDVPLETQAGECDWIQLAGLSASRDLAIIASRLGPAWSLHPLLLPIRLQKRWRAFWSPLLPPTTQQPRTRAATMQWNS